ncbi:MAG TPA: hypothetical protein DIC34_08230 [Treponema sp.]|nr:hypothetical protein [Treponema sp.]
MNKSTNLLRGKAAAAAAAALFSAFSSSSCAAGPGHRNESGAPSESWTPDLAEYRAFYGWDDIDGTWTWSRVRSGEDKEVAFHQFRNPDAEPKGTLFLLHGYLEHASLRVPIAREAVVDGWLAVGIDLPGHGLSSGVRADIGSFGEYTDALGAVVASRNWPEPWRLIAHSLGTATALLYIQRSGNPFEFVVLEAPLIRTYLWEPSVVAARIMGDAVRELPRRNAGIPKNGSFYSTLTEDPFYMERVPVGWFPALERYVKDSESWKGMEGRFLLLQGTADTVVDAKYNLPFLHRLIPGAEIVEIEKGGHHLLRDEGPAGDAARHAVRERWR